uniref:(California timema) hypothetical protein n=1 Tax=Timema californicum TaxID=61474 RepID=A0A7R9IYE5_TIMCA|nr:unnamed protein product [Timema californicum]
MVCLPRNIGNGTRTRFKVEAPAWAVANTMKAKVKMGSGAPKDVVFSTTVHAREEVASLLGHELQTCDWPRNVGCGSEGASATVSTVRVTDPRTRHTTPTGQSPSRSTSGALRIQNEQQKRQQQEEIAKHQLYADDLGPAEEIESDRQQRVYRGQPSILGQVARDRDGLRHKPISNTLSSGSGQGANREKNEVISFGNQQQSINTQYSYDKLTQDENRLTNETIPLPARKKRQVRFRVEPSPAPVTYIQQQSSQQTTSHTQSPSYFNSSQKYEPTQYDPYYNLYDDDVELYRDVDYGQLSSNAGPSSNTQYRSQSPYKQAPQPPQQEQRSASYAQPSYNTQDIYSQTLNEQDYNENFDSQQTDDQYQQQISPRQPVKSPARVRPTTTAIPEPQTTPVPMRVSTPTRNRGTASYTATGVGGGELVNRGTPASVRPDPVYPTPQVDKTAAKCRKDVCLLPDCYCGGKEIPGGLAAEEIPQLVLLTFDDAVNDLNKVLYSDLFEKSRKNPNGCPISATYYVSHEWTDYSQVQNLYADGDYTTEEIPQIVLLTFDDSANDLNKGLYSDLFEKGRTNPNGCPIAATFYVSHEWTDYSHVQNLYASGHEIASHSISHSFGEQFSQKKWTKEISGQREILAAYGGVKLEDVRGMRAPFLAVGGNKMFKMLYDSNFTYDSSMPVYENRPPSFPYTLDYKLFHDCMIPPCPTRSYPGVWEVPMVMWQDLNGGRCSMGDACSNPPTADGVYKMLIKNFERHYTTNRAPFGLFYHAAWFTQIHHKEGFIAFLDTLVAMKDVWLVSNWQAIQWVRDPTPLSRINNFPPFQCDYQLFVRCPHTPFPLYNDNTLTSEALSQYSMIFPLLARTPSPLPTNIGSARVLSALTGERTS